jgi:hypothetical protein
MKLPNQGQVNTCPFFRKYLIFRPNKLAPDIGHHFKFWTASKRLRVPQHEGSLTLAIYWFRGTMTALGPKRAKLETRNDENDIGRILPKFQIYDE